MPYKNVFLYSGVKLGSLMSQQDDAMAALREAYPQAEKIAGILRLQVKGVKASDIEIQCWWYDPQYSFAPELFPPKLAEIHASKGGNRPTLKTLKVG